MSDASCWTEECTFTGTQTQSNAEEGACTATAGYLANAEIQDILNNASRINQNYLDDNSYTNILVYDDVQWVGYMDDSNKATRQLVYQVLNMGGSTDWATDLTTYNNVPYPATSWTGFISDVVNGQDPLTIVDLPRTGNWTTVQCDVPAVNMWVEHEMTAEQRWSEMDGDDAWADVINQWLYEDQPTGKFPFTWSVSNTIHGGELTDCGSLGSNNNCQAISKCWYDPPGSDGAEGAGAVSYEIFNSLVAVHEVCIANLL